MEQIRSRLSVKRPLGVIIGGALIFGFAAAVISQLLPVAYEARTALLIGRSAAGSDPDYQDLLASQLLAQTYAEVASTRPILSAVVSVLGLKETPEQVAASMTAEASGLSIVRITIRNSDAGKAAAIANEVAQQLIAWRPAADSPDAEGLPQLRATLSTIDTQIARAQAEADDLQALGTNAPAGALQASLSRLAALLSTRATLLQLIANTSLNSVRVIEPSQRPVAPARPNVLLNVVGATLLGGLLAAGLLFAVSEVRSVTGSRPATTPPSPRPNGSRRAPTSGSRRGRRRRR